MSGHPDDSRAELIVSPRRRFCAHSKSCLKGAGAARSRPVWAEPAGPEAAQEHTPEGCVCGAEAACFYRTSASKNKHL